MAGRAEELERIIVALRAGTDVQASTLLARLRLGERVEDIARSLPATSLNTTVFSPSRYVIVSSTILVGCDIIPTSVSSLIANEPPSTSTSGISVDSLSNEESSSRHHGSTTTSLSFSSGQPPNRLIASTIATSSLSSSSAEGKQPMRADAEESPFLSLIFNRDDVLLEIHDSEDEADTDGEMDELFAPSWTGSIGSPSSSREVSENPHIPSRRNQHQKSIHATHLGDRQSIVNTLRIHPNFDIRNFFGNLPFSSSILANHNPLDVQELQIKNLFLPTWAMMTINTRPDPGSLRNIFSDILHQSTEMLQNGTPLDVLIETHPNIAALFDENEFNRSGILSKWSTGMVHSTLLKGKTRYSIVSSLNPRISREKVDVLTSWS